MLSIGDRGRILIIVELWGFIATGSLIPGSLETTIKITDYLSLLPNFPGSDIGTPGVSRPGLGERPTTILGQGNFNKSKTQNPKSS